MMNISIINKGIQKLWSDEEGLGTLEILLIVAVLVIVAIAFRKWIIKWIEELFTSTNDSFKGEGTMTDTLKKDAGKVNP
ncbi:Putative Flagellin, Flp1-like, domain [Paenibacillus sp. 1_12]|uniref:Flp1 family type IVb pilin n=1 Tax=Paenibacillus sp. 1_12 TaxID=1566278 RepID=UPI0008EC3BD2|nr:Putative Flagellin, Flp1-like, domain [Paenibacillus sp. 1_12]